MPLGNGIPANEISHYIGLAGKIWLNDLRYGIKPTCQRNGAGQMICQCRIDDRERWHHSGISQGDFSRCLRNCQHRILCNFRSSACCGRQRRKGQWSFLQRAVPFQPLPDSPEQVDPQEQVPANALPASITAPPPIAITALTLVAFGIGHPLPSTSAMSGSFGHRKISNFMAHLHQCLI